MRRPSGRETALAVAVLASAAVAAAASWQLTTAVQAWLAAYLFWVGLPVGALYLVLAHGLTGGAWGLTLRLPLAALLRTTPLLALFLAPVLLGARHVFPWATGDARGWLALPFFAGRAVVYVVLWNALALGALRRMGPGGRLPPGFAWPALILLFASTSLAAFDWVMTLEPRWTSTIFGLLVSAGWAVAAMAAAVLVASRLAAPGWAEPLDQPSRLLLALVMLWAYLAVIQLIVIWESDLSREIPWYLRRVDGGWRWAALAIAALQFALPFLTLIWRPLRTTPTAVALAAGSVFAGHLVETWWLTVPDFGRSLSWVDPVAAIGIGAAFVAVAAPDFDLRQDLPAGPRHARR